MAIHVAKCGDFDRISKGTIEEMPKWCVDNEELIFQVGKDYAESYDI